MSIIEIYKFFSSKYQNLFLEYKVNLRPRYGQGLPPHDLLYEIINSNRKVYVDLLEQIQSFSSKIYEIKKTDSEQDSHNPTWKNGYLPGLDMMALYAMISIFKPGKYIEVGSSYSTKVVNKAKKDNNLNTIITSIDPKPRVEIDEISQFIIREPFEKTDLTLFRNLKENDIIFIDNSHRILPNSDSTVFFLEVLPYLEKGVMIHFHDIYLPYDYPQYMCDRFYSEQYGLAIYLLSDKSRYEILLPNYFIYNDYELSKKIDSIWQHKNLDGIERHGGSFWLRIIK